MFKVEIIVRFWLEKCSGKNMFSLPCLQTKTCSVLLPVCKLPFWVITFQLCLQNFSHVAPLSWNSPKHTRLVFRNEDHNFFNLKLSVLWAFFPIMFISRVSVFRVYLSLPLNTPDTAVCFFFKKLYKYLNLSLYQLLVQQSSSWEKKGKHNGPNRLLLHAHVLKADRELTDRAVTRGGNQISVWLLIYCPTTGWGWRM